LSIIDPNSLIVHLSIPERMLAKLKLTDKVKVRIDAIGRQTFTGNIVRIHPTIDKQTRLGQIEIGLNPLPKGMKAGQFARVTIEKQTEPRLTLPYLALRRDHQGEYVFTVNEELKVQRQNVESGLRSKKEVEIVQGLQAGQVIVSKGFLGLREGKTVKLLDN